MKKTKKKTLTDSDLLAATEAFMEKGKSFKRLAKTVFYEDGDRAKLALDKAHHLFFMAALSFHTLVDFHVNGVSEDTPKRNVKPRPKTKKKS